MAIAPYPIPHPAENQATIALIKRGCKKKREEVESERKELYLELYNPGSAKEILLRVASGPLQEE